MKKLLTEVRACTICSGFLPFDPNPVIFASPQSKILVIGQAPGTKVHKTGIPWNDPSGNLLREWMDLDRDVFYDTENLALMPMGFCYPGKGKSGDLPPRKECASAWHEKLSAKMKKTELTLLIGQYSQAYYLGSQRKKTLAETVRNYKSYLPKYLPLPHPSPRNRLWLKKNPWFDDEVIPILKKKVRSILNFG